MTTRPPKPPRDLPEGVYRHRGRYRVIVYVGTDPVTGRQRRVTRTADTPRKAVKLRADLMVEVGAGRHRSGKLTVAQLLERYVRRLEARDASPSTIDKTRQMAATIINPRIGHLRVDRLDGDTLDGLYDDLRAHGRKCQRCWARLRAGLPALRDGEPYSTARPGPRRRCGAPRANGQACRKWTRYQSGRCERHGGTPASAADALEASPDRVHRGDCVAGQPMAPASVRRVHAVVSAALEGAPRKLLASNPARDASPPKLRRSEIRPPTSDDVGRFLAAAAELDPEWAAWLRLAAMTGARRGEVCAIRVSKFDLAAGEVRMDRGIVHAKDPRGRDRLVERPTKAETAKRLSLDTETLRLVRELIRRKKQAALRCGVRLHRDAYLFSQDPEGRLPQRPQTMTRRFIRLRDRLDLPGVRLHDLRHFVATTLLSEGVPVTVVAGRLGNDPRTLLRVYAHFLPGSDRAAGELLAGLVDGPPPPAAGEGQGS
jgi:integrase